MNATQVEIALADMPSPPEGLPASVAGSLRAAAGSVLLERYRFARETGYGFGTARDYYTVLGYDRQVTNRQYREEYQRGGIAGTIVDVMPDATWRGQMWVEEDEDPNNVTPFEQAWDDLDAKLALQTKMLRVDKVSRLSTFGVLLIGAPGDLDEELPHGKPEDLLYLTPFGGGGGPGPTGFAQRTLATDADASVFEFETDPTSRRFGLPLTYQLRRTNFASPVLARPVHWTRVIHVAENLLDDEVYGEPALMRVWNLLQDLTKVTGGGAEAFWLRANQGLHLDIDKDLGVKDATAQVEELKKQSEEYKHQLTRWLRTRGVNVSTLGSDVANFASPADAVLKQIAGAKRIPMRILTGSEMGELASSQDRENFKDQVVGRQEQHVGPNIVRQLVDRFIEYGYLPEPKDGPRAYRVKWPHVQMLTEQERAEGASKWSAINAQSKVPVFADAELRSRWYDMPPLDDEQLSEEKRRQELFAPPPPQPPPGEEPDAEALPPEERLKAAEHPGYVPHATVAYVKPGLGQKYTGCDDLAGLRASVSSALGFNEDQMRDEFGRWTSYGVVYTKGNVSYEYHQWPGGSITREEKHGGSVVGMKTWEKPKTHIKNVYDDLKRRGLKPKLRGPKGDFVDDTTLRDAAALPEGLQVARSWAQDDRGLHRRFEFDDYRQCAAFVADLMREANASNQVRGAEFNPDQPRDESGQWTAGDASTYGFLPDDVQRTFDYDNEHSPEWKAIFSHDQFLDDLDDRVRGEYDSEDAERYAEALQFYRGNGYLDVNGTLRRHPEALDEEEEDDEGDDDFEDEEDARGRALKNAKDLRDLLDEAPQLKEPVTIYRGLSSVFEANVGDEVQLNGFQSGTFDPRIAKNYAEGQTLFEMRAIEGLALGHAHSIKGEMEFIMDHGLVWRVAGVKTVDVGGEPTRVVQLVQGALEGRLKRAREKK